MLLYLKHDKGRQTHGKRGTLRFNGEKAQSTDSKNKRGGGKKPTKAETIILQHHTERDGWVFLALPFAEQWLALPKFGWLASIWLMNVPCTTAMLGWQVYKSRWKRLKEEKSRKRWLSLWKRSFANLTPLTFRTSLKNNCRKFLQRQNGNPRKDQHRRKIQNCSLW